LSSVVAEVGVDHVTARQRVFISTTTGSSSHAAFDLLRGVLGLGAGFGDDGRDRLALPARAFDCDRMLRSRFDAFQVSEHGDPRLQYCASAAPSTTAITPWHDRALPSSRASDPRVGVRAAEEHHVARRGSRRSSRTRRVPAAVAGRWGRGTLLPM